MAVFRLLLSARQRFLDGGQLAAVQFLLFDETFFEHAFMILGDGVAFLAFIVQFNACGFDDAAQQLAIAFEALTLLRQIRLFRQV